MQVIIYHVISTTSKWLMLVFKKKIKSNLNINIYMKQKSTDDGESDSRRENR